MYVVYHKDGPVVYPNIVRAIDQALLESEIYGKPVTIRAFTDSPYDITVYEDGGMVTETL